ncbi:hypothetical protein L1987_36486 [Smallanthus sonchifolius]|uniref:Uncharacterized protein n=1 Tax=Smallanthus sonchifolius TaxID=185202 RepID=A0ACB9HEY7_9ASTR|nr:hypothetical protein L1987_36486 [Smallanthus sonchifolius]
MANRWRCGVLMTLYLSMIAISIVGLSDGKELRPSNHGLTDEAEAPETAQAMSPEMSSFFGAGSTQPLPEARNYSDPSWSSGRVGGADHVKKLLAVSSLVCGIAGIVLLVVVGFLFLRRYRNQRSTLPGNSKQLEFGSMRTNGKAIAVHTIIFFAIYAVLVLALHLHIYTG